MKGPLALLCSVLALAAGSALAAREPVLKQIDLPHSYYYREMFLPQLTSGPSGVAFAPGGHSLVYSMAGSLWLQKIGEDAAMELTRGPGYDYQPDMSRDSRYIVFVRHHGNAVELWQFDVVTRREQQLTSGGAVNLQPRFSPDGRRIAYVSTAGTGHFNLFVADVENGRLGTPRAVVAPRASKIERYYYSTHDHAINPSWTPDGKRLVFVSNREVAYGTGDLCSVAVDDPGDIDCFAREETSWRAQPEVAPDGNRVLYSSYQGRQWHQLWLTTLAGDAALPLTFGELDITQARWSPDGKRIAYISNESGNLSLWVQDVVGGKRQRIEARQRRYGRPMLPVRIKVTNAQGQATPARISVVGGDRRAYGPADAWLHADDGFDPRVQSEETRYFHCGGECSVMLPEGDARVVAWRGHAHTPVQQQLRVGGDGPNVVTVSLRPLTLPAWAPPAVSADLHVHMNYGGHYRHTPRTLADQARAEDLDVIYNTIVNKEQRIPDIAMFDTKPFEREGVTIFQAQEYHTSFWGHLGLLHLEDRYLTPDFSAYRRSALSSPYPHNAVIADLAREQRGVVGYVHPYDWEIVPENEKSLTHALPADVALGKVDYLEVVAFSDHKATAAVWHRLLNLGFRVAAGAGTDAMANYASLRGPVGMNRVYLHSGGSKGPDSLRAALKQGRTVASNGPLLALQVAQRNPGDVITLPAGSHRLRYRAALRSPVPVDHLEVVHNRRVIATHRFGKQRTEVDMAGEIDVRDSGWVLLRAWSDDAHPLIFDLYPYATTSPIYVEVAGRPARSTDDAAYFIRWMQRVIDAARARTDYNDAREKEDTIAYLRAALAVFEEKARAR